MKVCISSEGKELYSPVDPRFGRCKYFIVADTETYEFKAFENQNLNASGGAGIQAGQFAIDNNVDAVLTGSVGPNAFKTLQAAGIEAVGGCSGNIRETIDRYKRGELKATSAASVGSKFGMNG